MEKKSVSNCAKKKPTKTKTLKKALSEYCTLKKKKSRERKEERSKGNRTSKKLFTL